MFRNSQQGSLYSNHTAVENKHCMGLAVVSFSRKKDRIWKMNKYEKFIAYQKKEVLILYSKRSAVTIDFQKFIGVFSAMSF